MYMRSTTPGRFMMPGYSVGNVNNESANIFTPPLCANRIKMTTAKIQQGTLECVNIRTDNDRFIARKVMQETCPGSGAISRKLLVVCLFKSRRWLPTPSSCLPPSGPILCSRRIGVHGLPLEHFARDHQGSKGYSSALPVHQY